MILLYLNYTLSPVRGIDYEIWKNLGSFWKYPMGPTKTRVMHSLA